ncbi:MAG: FAD-dependent oxidoreductase [bacterium]
MRIGIIGAGHAGIEAAKAASEQGADVVLFSAEKVLPYYRPRLVALAFGQAELTAIQIKPQAWYDQLKISLRLDARVLCLDSEKCEIKTSAGTDTFDGLVIACGGIPVMPSFSESCGPLMTPLWNVTHATAIRERIRKNARLVVVGGGILGIEAALHAIEADMSVVIIEKMNRLMPAQFGATASCALLRRLEEKGIRVLLARGVSSANEDSGILKLQIEGGESLEADLCLMSIGARPDLTLAVSGDVSCERGIVVDQYLQTPVRSLAAAGDVIQFEGVTRCSMKEASTQGRLAALNLVARLRGQDELAYVPETIPLTFRSKDFEIYSIGETAAPGSEERLLDGSTESLIRALVIKDGIPVGVQMIGTRDGFDAYATQVKKAQKK